MKNNSKKTTEKDSEMPLNNWMGYMAENDTTGWVNRPLNRITMPSAHDAFIYRPMLSDTGVGNEAANAALAQVQAGNWKKIYPNAVSAIKMQLQYGVRHFDIRPCKFYNATNFGGSSSLRSHHTSYVGSVFSGFDLGVQGVTCALESRLKEMSDWLSNNPTEIAILWFNKYTKIAKRSFGYSSGWKYGSTNDDDWLELIEMVESCFTDNQIYKSSSVNTDIGTLSYQDIIDGSVGKAILVYDEIPGHYHNGTIGRFSRGGKGIFDRVSSDEKVGANYTAFTTDEQESNYYGFVERDAGENSNKIKIGKWSQRDEENSDIAWKYLSDFKLKNGDDLPPPSQQYPSVQLMTSQFGDYIFLLYPSESSEGNLSLNLVCISSEADFSESEVEVLYAELTMENTQITSTCFPAMTTTREEVEIHTEGDDDEKVYEDVISIAYSESSTSSIDEISIYSCVVTFEEDGMQIAVKTNTGTGETLDHAPNREDKYKNLSIALSTGPASLSELRWYFTVNQSLYASGDSSLTGNFMDITPVFQNSKYLDSIPDSAINIAFDSAGILYMAYISKSDTLTIMYNDNTQNIWEYEQTGVPGLVSAPCLFCDPFGFASHELYISWCDSSGNLILEVTEEVQFNTTRVPTNRHNDPDYGDRGPDITARINGEMTVVYSPNTNSNLVYLESLDGGQTWSAGSKLGQTTLSPSITTAYYGAVSENQEPSAYEVIAYTRTDSHIGIKSRKVAPSRSDEFDINTTIKDFKVYGSPAICSRKPKDGNNPSVAIVSVTRSIDELNYMFYRPDTDNPANVGSTFKFKSGVQPKVKQVAVQSHPLDLMENGFCVLWVAYLDQEEVIWVGRYDTQQDKWVTQPQKVTGIHSVPVNNSWGDRLVMDVTVDLIDVLDDEGNLIGQEKYGFVKLYFIDGNVSKATDRTIQIVSSSLNFTEEDATFGDWSEIDTGVKTPRCVGITRVEYGQGDSFSLMTSLGIDGNKFYLSWQIADGALGIDHKDYSNMKMYGKNPKTQGPRTAMARTKEYYETWVTKQNSESTEFFNGLYVVQQQSSTFWDLLDKSFQINRELKEDDPFPEYSASIHPPSFLAFDAYLFYHQDKFNYEIADYLKLFNVTWWE